MARIAYKAAAIRRPTTHAFRISILAKCRVPAASLKSPAPHIEYRVSAEFATCLPNLGSGFPPLLSPAYAREGKEPLVGPLCQHLNANFPVRSLSPILHVCRCRGLKTASGIAFAWKCVPRRRGRRALLRVYRASPKPLRKCKLRRRWLANV